MSLPFIEGFESGTTNAWTGTFNSGAISINQNSAYVHTGSYSIKYSEANASSSYAYLYKTLSGATNIRAYIYVPDSTFLLADGDFLGVLGFEQTVNSTTAEITLCRSNGTMFWGIRDGNTQINNPSSIAVTSGVWHCIELAYNSSGGTITFYLDGGTNTYSISSSCARTVGDVRAGGYCGYTGPTSFSIYFDDIEANNGYIGLLGGGTASKLWYTVGSGQSVYAGSVSSVITVQVQDSNGNPVTSGATVSLSTTATGSGTFYSDSGGNTQITSLIISSGQSSGSFYYKDTTAGTPTLTASATGLTSATTQFTINTSSPTDLTVTGDLTVDGTTVLYSNATVTQNITAASLSISGNTTIEGNATIGGNAIIDGSLLGNGWALNGPSDPGQPYLTFTNTGNINNPITRYLYNWSDRIALALPNSGNKFSIEPGIGNSVMSIDNLGNMTVQKITFPVSNKTTSIQATLGPMSSTYPLLLVQYGLQADDIQAYGLLASNTNPAADIGGGAILIGHGLTNIWDPPRITLTDTINVNQQNGALVDNLHSSSGYYSYDTLYITKSDLYPNQPQTITDATMFDPTSYITNWELGNLAVGSIRQPFTVGNGGVTIGQLVSLDSNYKVVPACSSNGSAIIGVATQTTQSQGIVNVIIWGLARVAVATTINPGDRVCASSTPGSAAPYTSTTATGQVIGKALTYGTPQSPGYIDMIVSISS